MRGRGKCCVTGAETSRGDASDDSLAHRATGGHAPTSGRSDQVWIGPVRSEDGVEVAYVKTLPGYKLVREVVCALAASACGLPVPAAAIAQLDDAPFEHDERFGFATLATDAAPIANQDALLERLHQWPQLHAVIAFDEWITNSDRTAKNLLFRGAGDFVLIMAKRSRKGPSRTAR